MGGIPLFYLLLTSGLVSIFEAFVQASDLEGNSFFDTSERWDGPVIVISDKSMLLLIALRICSFNYSFDDAAHVLV